MRRETIRLATRGSALAVSQATVVKSALEERRHDVELVEIETTGDRVRDELIHRLGTTGAFVRSLDERILDGTVDAAVHSLKDVPTEQPDDLIFAAVPERAAAGDVLVTPDGRSLDELSEGAVVGTSSLRRRAQLLAARPDLSVVPLRGNVDTRVEKLLAPSLQRERDRRRAAQGNEDEADGTDTGEADGTDAENAFERSVAEWLDDRSTLERRALERSVDEKFDAIVLAAAGLERSSLLGQLQTYPLPLDRFVPAPGQGAITVTMRDTELAQLLHRVLDNPRTRVEVTVERTILSHLGGGCIAPLGMNAIVQGEFVRTRVQVLSQDGTEVLDATRDLPIQRYTTAARSLADDLARRGARDLVEAAKKEPATEPSREEE